jgi:hypothetical protein
VPRIVWVPGTTMGSGRPGSASAGEGTVWGVELKNLMDASYSRTMTGP